MNCDRIEELMPRYIEGDLAEEERILVESHVSSCLRCRESLEAFGELEASLSSLREAVPSWRTAEKRFVREAGLEKRRSLSAVVCNAPFVAGLSFIALGIVLFARRGALRSIFQSLGSAFAASFDGFTRAVADLYASVAALDPLMLITVYGLLTFALMCGTSALAFRFSRK